MKMPFLLSDVAAIERVGLFFAYRQFPHILKRPRRMGTRGARAIENGAFYKSQGGGAVYYPALGTQRAHSGVHKAGF